MLRDHFYICPSSILYNVGSLLSLKKAMVSCSLYMVGFCFPPLLQNGYPLFGSC